MRKRSIVRSIEASIFGTGSPACLGELAHVVAVVAVLRHRLAPTKRLDGRAEALHLRAGVVVVVLALDRITAEGEKPCDAVAVGTVPGGGHDDRPRRVGRDQLDLDPRRAHRPAAAVVLPHLAERLDEESVSEAEVDEPRPGDLRRLDLVRTRDAGGELLRELARRPPHLLRRAQRDVRRKVAVRRVLRPLEADVSARECRDARLEALYRWSCHARNLAGVSSAWMDDDPIERQLNIHMDPALLAGVYANFANITFSDYEFTLTFARIDHEVEEGDVPGVVVTRVNMSQQFMKELLAAMQDAYSKYTTVKGIQDLPEAEGHR